MDNLLNLDANASFGLLSEVEEELRDIAWTFHNPSSVHRAGQASRAAIDEARGQVAALMRLEKGQRVIFTSGASEANNMAVNYAVGSGTRNVVISAVEHPSTLEPARRLQRSGVEVRLVSPEPNGALAAPQFADAVDQNTKFCSCMLANNETGRVYPVREIARAVKERSSGVLFHTDAVQALGKMPITFSDLGTDLCTVSAHKIGGLAGVGALVVSESVAANPFIVGGPQETRWRSGTENVLGIISFGIAARIALATLTQRIGAMRRNRDFLKQEILRRIPTALVNTPDDGLPNTCHISIPGVRADDLVVALDLQNVLISSGAACASGKPEPSHVLLAQGMPSDLAQSSVRLSVRGYEHVDELARAAREIQRYCEARC